MRIIELEQTCYACPSQWSARTLYEQEVYIRYRWGYLSVKVDGNEVYGEQLGDDLSGVLSEGKLIQILQANNLMTYLY